jgi:shikimate kinase
VIYSEKAMKFLKNNSLIIFLDAKIESIIKRISKSKKERGIIGLKNKSIKEIFEERLPLYKKYANITINLSDKINIKKIANEISKLKKKTF